MPGPDNHGPNGSEESDDDILSLFGGVGDGENEVPAGDASADDADEIDVDDDADAYKPAFPPVPFATPRPAPVLPDPRAAPPSYDIPELSMPVSPRPYASPRAPSTRLPGDGESTFFWGLTPNDEPDPLVHGQDDASGSGGDGDGTRPVSGETPRTRGLVPPTIPLAPYVAPDLAQPADPAAAPEQPTAPLQPAAPSVGSEQPAIPTPQAPPVPPVAWPIPASPVVPSEEEPPTVAMPSWIPSDGRGPQPPEPWQATAPEELAEPSEPLAPDLPAEPSVPGVVTLPWLRRSRSRTTDQQGMDQPGSTPPMDAPTSAVPAVPDAPTSAVSAGPDAPTSAVPGRPDAPTSAAFGTAGSAPDEAAGEANTASVELGAAEGADSAAGSTSWSLFGDLFDEQNHGTGADSPPADAEPTAAATTAFDLPARDVEAPSWPWGASAVATPATAALAADSGGAPAEVASSAAAPVHAAGTPSSRRARGSRDSRIDSDSAGAAAAAGGAALGPTGGWAGSRFGASSHGHDAGGPSPRAQRIMLIVAGGMLLVLLLIALFIVGRNAVQPTALVTPSPSPTKTATPTPTPTPTAVAATGPQAPGVHPWNTLRGGECLQPLTTAWADKFTVVDCATPHAGQMVYTGVFTTDPKAVFPGADQLASQINLLCSRPGVLNLDAAGRYDDAQMQGTYPVTKKQWKSGQRSYYCFVSRSSGQPITGSLAGPGPQ